MRLRWSNLFSGHRGVRRSVAVVPVNALRQVRERMGLAPKQMAHALDISERTLRDQEREREPRRVYLLAALRVEDVRSMRDGEKLEAVRGVLRQIGVLCEKGQKL